MISKYFLSIGTAGLAVHNAVNLIALLLLKKPNALYFSEGWWTAWFPSLICWPIFLIIGMGFMLSESKKSPNLN